MTLPRLTEAIIRQATSDEAFQLGQEYEQADKVIHLISRGFRLEAAVTGTLPYPYQVRIDFDLAGITGATCTCSQSRRCKHIAATLLVVLHRPDQIEVGQSVESRLAELNQEQLLSVLQRLLAGQPDLAETIEALLPSSPPTAASRPETRATPPLARQPLDPTAIRRHARASRAGVSFAVGEIEKQVLGFLDVANPGAALGILHASTDGYIREFESFDDSDGQSASFFEDLGALWTEVMLSVDLTPTERESWVAEIEEWAEFLADYGIDEPFDPVLSALEYGWDEQSRPPSMTDDDAGSAENGEDAHSRLAVARLNVLARQGRVDEFLQRARAERQFLSLATMLLKLERVDEAVAVGRQHLTSAEETFTLAQLLRARGHPELALDIAEMGLGREGYLSSLAVWTRDLASGLGLTDRALPAALIAYRATPELPTYLAVAELAGPAWPGMRDDLLASARAAQTYNTAGIVDVLLHENLVADAIDVVDKRYAYYDVVRQVADAATATHPDWVIRTCTRQAEEIMNRGKADAYHHAADWLAKTKRAYHAAGREAEWQNYLAELLTLHHRKSKLRPLLEALRR